LETKKKRTETYVTTNSNKPRLEYLDVYRALAIMAVITIHVTSFPMVNLPSGTWQQWFYQILNGASNFAVPSFLFLSGLVLFYNYYHRTQGNKSWIAQFYKKRLMYILIPYVLWSFFYYASVQYMTGSSVVGNLDAFLLKLLDGKNYTHLYYFIIILQFYVLFPLLLKLARNSFINKYIVPIAAVVQIAFLLANTRYLHINQTGILFITYFLHFCTGAYIGIHYERIFRALKRRSPLIGAILLISVFAYIFAGKMYYQWFPALLPYKSYLNFAIYYVFTLSASVFLVLFSSFIDRSGDSGRTRNAFQRMLHSIGASSFAIFLVHPFILVLWRKFVVANSGAYYHYATLSGWLAALFGSWAFYLLLSRWKRWTWIMIGK
jgi:probable poly-beta-1,6-N-acetyl-D-glucosamine export protein